MWFHQIPALQKLQSHQHNSPWNVFPSTLLKLHFLVIISVISQKTPPESSKLPWFPSAGSQNGVGEWKLQEFTWIHEEYLQNTGQQRAGEGGQRGWGASASRAWASPPLPGALQTLSQGPRTPARGKTNRKKWGMKCSQGLFFGTFQAVLTRDGWREKFQGGEFCLKIFQGQNSALSDFDRFGWRCGAEFSTEFVELSALQIHHWDGFYYKIMDTQCPSCAHSAVLGAK